MNLNFQEMSFFVSIFNDLTSLYTLSEYPKWKHKINFPLKIFGKGITTGRMSLLSLLLLGENNYCMDSDVQAWVFKGEVFSRQFASHDLLIIVCPVVIPFGHNLLKVTEW